MEIKSERKEEMLFGTYYWLTLEVITLLKGYDLQLNKCQTYLVFYTNKKC